MSVSNKMIVPKTITVGYNNRTDTYTGKLGFVVYTDDKGVLRQETSWEGWRDKKLGKDTYDNEPRSGFVLNRKVGGVKYHSWNPRQTKVRCWDPHGFEFEISIPNLLFILQETSSIQGKGLEGEFVYAWHGKDIVLLPTCSAEYKACTDFTKAKAMKVAKDDKIEGHVYLMKDMTEVLYLGKHDFCEKNYRQEYKPVGPRHVFQKLKIDPELMGFDDDEPVTEAELAKEEEKMLKADPYVAHTGFDKVAKKISTEVSPLYANAFTKFKRSRYNDKVVEVKLRKVDIPAEPGNRDYLVLKEKDKTVLVTLRYQGDRYDHNARKWVYQTPRFIRCGDINLETNKNGTIEVPKVSRYYYTNKDEPIAGRDFYSATLVTAKGHSLPLDKQL